MHGRIVGKGPRWLALLSIGGLLIGGGLVTTHASVDARAADTTTTASQEVLHAGEFGTSHWSITADHTLHIGAGTLGAPAKTPDGPPWKPYGAEIENIVIEGPVVLNANSRMLFGYLGVGSTGGTIKGLDQVDASHVTNFEFAFYGIQVAKLDLSSWDVHNVTNTSFMFGQATSQVIDLTGWQLPKLTNTYWMFMLAARVHELDLSGFNLRHASTTQMLMNTNLTVLHLGPDSLLSGTNLRTFSNAAYQDHWQDVGTGTLEAPQGSHVYTAAQLMANFKGAAPYTYVRARNTGAPVTVHYVDTADHPLAPDEVHTGFYDAPFTITPKTIAGYTLDHTDGAVTGTFGANPGTVTCYYVPAKNQQSLTGQDATVTVGDARPDSATFHARATDKAGQPIPVTVDLDHANLTQPGTYPVILKTTDGQAKTVQLTVKAAEGGSSSVSSSSNSSSASSSTDSTSSSASSSTTSSKDIHYGGDQDLGVFKGEAIYATKALRLYRHPTFKANQVKARYAQQSRIKRPMFVVTGAAKSRNGALRFKVRDVNHTAKTDGRVGYLTAKRAYVTGVYYQQRHPRITVINPRGVNAYRRHNLTGKVHHYRRGQTVRVRRIVHYHLTTRYVLPNGRYITANKKLVRADLAAFHQSTQHSLALRTRMVR
ncbi:DUF5776 domain-containing protein [Levilactobacillus namurensis]|uniref:DUF5776 domain-containing protein n=1 Tax=Levilactobacillus namurensis TaxID=380393 RepID=UPI00222E95C1|nr:DUF5776 domain-containing protein [Levilactobacillus namurensis]MCW3779264.1 DUF5776 domain-containing protein [Levilactobacillus namurensis]MDT7019843.1 DUF5776 domain-containing protein [Levilactobacillus namurensis]WNN65573.1 DUF5776 domain-containing protein [Levilactobacillus namurensis]